MPAWSQEGVPVVERAPTPEAFPFPSTTTSTTTTTTTITTNTRTPARHLVSLFDLIGDGPSFVGTADGNVYYTTTTTTKQVHVLQGAAGKHFRRIAFQPCGCSITREVRQLFAFLITTTATTTTATITITTVTWLRDILK